MKTLNILMTRLLMSVVLLAMLNACGGGNGSAGAPMGSGGENANGKITLRLVDASGQATTTVGPNGAQVIANVVDAFGAPVSNIIVTFTLSKNPSIVNISNDLVVTDKDGNASVTLSPTEGSSGKSGEVTAAAAIIVGSTLTDVIGFKVQ